MTSGQEPPDEWGAPRGDDPGAGWGDDPPPASGWGDDRAFRSDHMRPLTLGDVLDGTFRLAVAQWRAFTVAGGLMVIGTLVVLAVLTGIFVAAMPGLGFLTDPAAMADPTSAAATLGSGVSVATLVGALLLVFIGFVLLGALVHGIGVHIAAIGYRSGTVNPMTSLRAVARRLPALLGTMFLTVLVIGALLFIPIILFVGIAGATDSGGLAAIGVIAALVVAVIAGVRLAVAVPVLLVEGLGPAGALRRSNHLVKGRTGMTFLTLLVVGIMVFIVGLVLQMPFGLIAGLAGDNAFGGFVNLVGQFVNSVVSLALSSASIVLIYFDRRIRTEGYDLVELAQELGERRDEQG